MELYCTRPGCPRPLNFFSEPDDPTVLKRVSQKYCTSCGMPLILRDRYLPSKLLGQGGFGVAVLARDRDTPTMRPCVVKLFQPSGDLSPHQLQKSQDLFEREAEVLEQLGNQHPQIPELYAFFELTVPSLQPGKQDRFFYLVQEFIDGETLEKELEKKGKFSQEEVLEILREILPVLQFVHEQGSIHRDIKPSNIIRSRQGRLYLLDFGAVKQVTKVAASGSSSRSTGIYSMGFAPPEQMSGGEIYPSTDLYALAVTCLILLTGKSPKELYDSYKNEWQWRNYAQVKDSFANILTRMLSPAPNQRFQSAEEVLQAITPINSPKSVQLNPIQPNLPPTQPPIIPPQPLSRPRFSLLEVLGGAAFTGFEGALLAIALTSILPSIPGITFGLLGMILGGFIFAQYRRIIEGKDLPIIIGITLAIVFFLPGLHAVISNPNIGLMPGNPLAGILLVAILSAAGSIALTALFRLIYKLLYRLF